MSRLVISLSVEGYNIVSLPLTQELVKLVYMVGFAQGKLIGRL